MKRLDLENPAASEAWDAFCVSRPWPSLFHSARWARAIGRVYGAECRSLAWEAPDGSIQGILPLFQVRRLGGPRVCVSVPYAPYGGALTGAGQSTLEFLAGLVPEAAGSMGAAGFALREVRPGTEPAAANTARITMWRDLPDSEDVLWKGLDAKVRNQVRKAQTQGVTLKVGAGLLDDFYGLYSRRMHELGTPAHSPRFFQALTAEFVDAAEFVVAYHGGTALAAIFDIDWGRFRVNLYGASDYARRALCGNNLVYWESLRRGVAQQKARFDFGRSLEGSGQHRFKEQWGAKPVPVCETQVRYDTVAGRWDEQPVAGYSSRLANVWRRLPRAVVNRLAPRLRRFVF